MTKRRLATGIYQDASGIAIRISVRGEPVDFRKNEKGRKYSTFTLDQLLIERKRIDAREHLKDQVKTAAKHTLRADADEYVKTLPKERHTRAHGLLAHWLRVFGDRPRHDLTALELRQHAATWVCAASSFNHRRQELINIYKTLDPTGPNPAREIPKRTAAPAAPRALSYDVITALLDRMPECKTRARLKVMAYTGLPQMQIAKLVPSDWHGATLRVSPRRKGAGAAGRVIPISPEAQAALAEFARLDAWGPFARTAMVDFWHRHKAPAGSTPYSLRHSWITELYRRSNGDMLALQQLALHSQLSQTQHYAAAGLERRMEALVLPRDPYHEPAGESSKKLRKSPVQKAKTRTAIRRKSR